MLRSNGCASAWPSWNAASPGRLPEFEPAWIDPAWIDPARIDPALIAGIAAYRRHPWQRTLPDPAVIWEEGGTRLLDYGAPDALPLLVVPSLVNRAYILDLDRGRSMLRWLAAQGCRPLLLDWGAPDAAAASFTLTDYVAGRLERALAVAGPVALVGYCMGGLLALALALRRPEAVTGLALLATPWDFHAGDAAQARALAAALPALEPMMAAFGVLPTDALQWLLAAADLPGAAERFAGFAAVDPDSERARAFVAMEDWLADGVPLAAPVARECLGGWYGRNAPAAGQWRIAGAVVDPRAIAVPSFVALPGRDRVVPPASAEALARLIPGALAHRPAAGHVGMAAGAGAEAALWRPLLAWLRGLSG